MALKLGIPSKGRLKDKTFDWFSERGVEMQSTGNGREYTAEVSLPGLELVMLAAGEIPRELQSGQIDLGVTGMDMIRERLWDWPSIVREVAPLGFGHADLIIAVPDFWSDVATLHDFDAAASAFRRTHGHRLRIATKYHRLVREFLRAEGVADYRLVDSQGATEGTVRNLSAEAIADITTTGETLRANHLRPLEDGVILKSQAALFRTPRANWTPEMRTTYTALCEALDIDP
ncbi:MAG: ATP phosphoribosyltransferase [Pseudomonadota bacterium]